MKKIIFLIAIALVFFACKKNETISELQKAGNSKTLRMESVDLVTADVINNLESMGAIELDPQTPSISQS